MIGPFLQIIQLCRQIPLVLFRSPPFQFGIQEFQFPVQPVNPPPHSPAVKPGYKAQQGIQDPQQGEQQQPAVALRVRTTRRAGSVEEKGARTYKIEWPYRSAADRWPPAPETDRLSGRLPVLRGSQGRRRAADIGERNGDPGALPGWFWGPEAESGTGRPHSANQPTASCPFRNR
jgi:hypothetical protein